MKKQNVAFLALVFLLSFTFASLAQVSASPAFTMTFVYPTEGAILNADNFVATISANEVLDSMDINLDGGAYYHACNNCNGFNVPVDRLADGAHTLNLIGISGSTTKDITLHFTVDTQDPSVTSTTPTSGATGVAANSNIVATFSETMDSSTISTGTFTLRDNNAAAVTGSVSYSGNTATFNPTNDLQPNTVYTASLSTSVEDMAGNSLPSTYSWSFTTAGSTTTPNTTTPSGPYAGYSLVFVYPTEGMTINADNFVASIQANETISSMDINLDGGANYHACDNCNGFTVPVDRLSEGAHTLNLRGTWGSFIKDVTLHFNVDTTPETTQPLTGFAINSPVNGQTYNDSIVLNVNVGNAQAVNYSIDNGAFLAYSSQTTIPLAAGSHSIIVRAASTGQFNQTTINFNVVNTTATQNPPQNTTNNTASTLTGYLVQSPLQGASYNDVVPVTITTGTATNVNYSIDSGSTVSYSSPVSVSLAAGSHTITIRASSSGAYNETVRTFTIVNTTVVNPPANDTNTTQPVMLEGYNINSPKNGFTYNDTVRVNISRGNANVVNYSIDNGAFVAYTEITTISLTEGDHTLVVRAATDDQYNETTINFHIVNTTVDVPVNNGTGNDTNHTDSEGMLFNVTSPMDGHTYNDSIFLNITDCDHDSINYSIDGGQIVDYMVTGPTRIFLAAGNHTLVVSASSSLSNVSEQIVIRFAIVNTTVVVPENNTNNNQTTTPPTNPGSNNNNNVNNNVNNNGGSGGSGGGAASSLFRVSEAASVGGYTQNLGAKDKIQFSLIGNSSAKHILMVNSVSNTSVSFKVENIVFNLGLGESTRINLTSADRYDLEVTLNSVKNGKANVTIQAINVSMPVASTFEVESNTNSDSASTDSTDEAQDTEVATGNSITGNAVSESETESRNGLLRVFNFIQNIFRNMFGSISGLFNKD
jgi:hypothetical protein